MSASNQGTNSVSSSYWSTVSLGTMHSCGILTSGVTHCWGSNDMGQSDLSTVHSGSVSTNGEYNHPSARSVSAGDFHTCVILLSGSLRCAGMNRDGQSAVPFGFAGGARLAAAGLAHTCALSAAGYLQCWGNGGAGQTRVPAGLRVGAQAVAAGAAHSCAVAGSGGLYCWGDFNAGVVI